MDLRLTNVAPTIVDDKLYIDGGHVYFKDDPQSVDYVVEPNNRLIALDLNSKQTWQEMKLDSIATPEGKPPTQLSNIFSDKNGQIYFPNGGYVTLNMTAKNFYEPPRENTPTDKVWSYNPKNDEWKQETFKGDKFVNTVGSAGTNSPTAAFSLNGYTNYMTTLLPSDDMLVPQEGMLKFDFETKTVKNITTPFPSMANGFLEYLPLGKEGILVAYGGSQYAAGVPAKPNTRLAPDMSRIRIFDIATEQWHEQTATGVIDRRNPNQQIGKLPPARMMGCSVVAMAPDSSSANIYMYSGEMPPYGFPDVWVLTIPSFRWVQMHVIGAVPTIGQKCVAKGRNMFIFGGQETPKELVCQVWWKVFDMTSLKFTHEHDPKDHEYSLPLTLYDLLGGNDKGGATLLTPEKGWASKALEEVFFGAEEEEDRSGGNTNGGGSGTGTGTKTRLQLPTISPNNAPPPTSDTTQQTSLPSTSSPPIPAIVGATVGATVALIALCAALFLCYRRRKRRAVELSSSYHPYAPFSRSVSSRPSFEKSHYGGSSYPLSPPTSNFQYTEQASPPSNFTYTEQPSPYPAHPPQTAISELATSGGRQWQAGSGARTEADSSAVHELSAQESLNRYGAAQAQTQAKTKALAMDGRASGTMVADGMKSSLSQSRVPEAYPQSPPRTASFNRKPVLSNSSLQTSVASTPTYSDYFPGEGPRSRRTTATNEGTFISQTTGSYPTHTNSEYQQGFNTGTFGSRTMGTNSSFAHGTQMTGSQLSTGGSYAPWAGNAIWSESENTSRPR